MKFKRVLFILLITLFSLNKVKSQSRLSIIPEPYETHVLKGFLELNTIYVSINNDALIPVKEVFVNQVKDRFQLKTVDNSKNEIKKIILKIILDSEMDNEAYSLAILKNKIIVKATSAHGVFNGLQSLMQLLYQGKRKGKNTIIIPQCEINDAPRFGWRGFMLDESRHFFGKEKVMQLLDLMALHKLNVFHWHLTDEPGWRIEIKKYPKLTSIGAQGNYSNAKAPVSYYTQEDIKNIVTYASKLFIEVIPEIDMPGHASAAVRSYPEFSGGGSKKHPNFTFNPGKEGTYQFLTNILKEVSTSFPSPYIHIGGDEVHYGNENWQTDADVLELMRKNKLKNMKEVEKHFINRMGDSIHSLTKKVIGWDEMVNFGIDTSKGDVVMWWRHDKKEVLEKAIQKNQNIVLCPRIPMYFDFVQDASLKNGRKWGEDFGNIKDVYHFPDELDIEMNKQIKGIQANLWTERYSSNKSLDFALFPRISALSEAAWCEENKKSYISFKKKLKDMYAIYDAYGIYYFDLFYPKKHLEPNGALKADWRLNHREK